MNDKDKEAFESWYYEHFKDCSTRRVLDYLNPLDLEIWQAACEYMRNKSNPLDALSLYEKLERERNENKKLREALEFYAKTESWDADGVICGDTYAPWGEQGIEVGGKRAVEALKEVEK